MTEKGKGELSAPLAALLSTDLRAALDHPRRRRLLRVLGDDGGELSAAELRGRGCAPCTLACATYHLGVLAEAGLVQRLTVGSVQGRTEYAFAATIAGKPAVIEVLQATAAEDGHHPEPARA